jgi:hypothetical protein
MKNILILLLIAAALVTGCRKKKVPAKDVVYFNDAEQYIGWSGYGTLKQVPGGGHSGAYASVTDTMVQYSLGLRETYSKIKEAETKTISVTSWIQMKDSTAKGCMVVSIDEAGKSLDWKCFPVETVIKEVNKWQEMKFKYSLPGDLPPGAVITIYLWNTGKKEIWIDDIEVKLSRI